MFEDIIGRSPMMTKFLDTVAQVAASEAVVLIMGESGTGKEMIAKAIHFNSPRQGGPFIKINCGALTETLLESELFGHEKGSFTGAHKRHSGLFRQADGGTLLLDEVGEMSLAMQAKLLRVLQEGEINRVGGEEVIKVNVRVLSATNKDLAIEVKDGKFREDLYYRLNVVDLKVPLLRERKEDIPLLAVHYLKIYSEKNKKNIVGFTPPAMEKLNGYDWPGNVRQLKNAIERSVVFSQSDQISAEELLFTEESDKSTEPVLYKASISVPENLNMQNYKELCDFILKNISSISKENLLAILRPIAKPLTIWPPKGQGVFGLGRELLIAFENHSELLKYFDSNKVEKIFNCLRLNHSFDKECEGSKRIEKLLKRRENQSLPHSLIDNKESVSSIIDQTQKQKETDPKGRDPITGRRLAAARKIKMSSVQSLERKESVPKDKVSPSGIRLQSALDIKKIHIKDFAAEFNTSVATIRKWFLLGIPEEYISATANFLNVEEAVFRNENLENTKFKRIIQSSILKDEIPITAERLQIAINIKKIKQKKFAKLLNTSIAKIQKWLNTGVTEDYIAAVANFFKVEEAVFRDENIEKTEFIRIIGASILQDEITITAKRLQIALAIMGIKFKKMAADLNIPVDAIHEWQTMGIPADLIPTIANYFKVERSAFTDKRLSQKKFKQWIRIPIAPNGT